MKPKQYVKKPVVIDAVQYEDNDISRTVIMQWLGEHETLCRIENGKLVIPTLEGDMSADYGDYIIKGVKGEFYPCKPDIFSATYEEVPSDAESPAR